MLCLVILCDRFDMKASECIAYMQISFICVLT
jgi:hypothetical protein